ncbi:MAG: hypothetical protein QM520_01775 [Gammaproteobacteria bacterium]|nr:hypothetical protein [Gammaproteobacteria bacterium]
MNKPIQPGVALMMALLTVALVSVISLSFLSLQTQRIEVESARRQQQQAQWLLKGIIDWARLVL